MVGKCCGQRDGSEGGVGAYGPTGKGFGSNIICCVLNGQTNQTNGIFIPTGTGMTTGASTGKEVVLCGQGTNTNVGVSVPRGVGGFKKYCEGTSGSTSGHNELICHGTDQRRKDLIDQIKIFLHDFDDRPCVVTPKMTGRHNLTRLGQYEEYLMKHSLSWTPPNPSPPLITSVGAHEIRPTDDYDRKCKENDESVTYVDIRTKPTPLSCDCAKRNGLQDQCTMIGCSPPTPQCLASNPGPCCPPSMGVKVSVAKEVCRTGGQSRRKTNTDCGHSNKIEQQVMSCNTQQIGGNTGRCWVILGGTGAIPHVGGQGEGCACVPGTTKPPRPVICSTGTTAPPPRPIYTSTTGGQGQYGTGHLGVCLPKVGPPRVTAPVTQPGVNVSSVGGQGQQGTIGGQGQQYNCVCNVGDSAMPSGKKYLCCPAP